MAPRRAQRAQTNAPYAPVAPISCVLSVLKMRLEQILLRLALVLRATQRPACSANPTVLLPSVTKIWEYGGMEASA
jgi:hypothetical protein